MRYDLSAVHAAIASDPTLPASIALDLRTPLCPYLSASIAGLLGPRILRSSALTLTSAPSSRLAREGDVEEDLSTGMHCSAPSLRATL
eukprot:5427611-Pleurochrysis_carterae.AAC.2